MLGNSDDDGAISLMEKLFFDYYTGRRTPASFPPSPTATPPLPSLRDRDLNKSIEFSGTLEKSAQTPKKSIIVGVVAMEVKTRAKPMREILSRLRAYLNCLILGTATSRLLCLPTKLFWRNLSKPGPWWTA
jgi:hypothetical protein